MARRGEVDRAKVFLLSSGLRGPSWPRWHSVAEVAECPCEAQSACSCGPLSAKVKTIDNPNPNRLRWLSSGPKFAPKAAAPFIFWPAAARPGAVRYCATATPSNGKFYNIMRAGGVIMLSRNRCFEHLICCRPSFVTHLFLPTIFDCDSSRGRDERIGCVGANWRTNRSSIGQSCEADNGTLDHVFNESRPNVTFPPSRIIYPCSGGSRIKCIAGAATSSPKLRQP